MKFAWNSRKHLVVATALIAVAIVCAVMFFFRARTSERYSFNPPEKNPQFGVGNMNWEPLPSPPSSKPVEFAQARETSRPTVSGTQFASPQPAASLGLRLLFQRRVPLFTIQIGVFDVDRVFDDSASL